MMMAGQLISNSVIVLVIISWSVIIPHSELDRSSIIDINRRGSTVMSFIDNN